MPQLNFPFSKVQDFYDFATFDKNGRIGHVLDSTLKKQAFNSVNLFRRNVAKRQTVYFYKIPLNELHLIGQIAAEFRRHILARRFDDTLNSASSKELGN